MRRNDMKRYVRPIAVLALIAVFLQVHTVHEQGWEIRLWPSQAPPKVQWHDRDYDRGDHDSAIPDPDAVPMGHTPGGGTILAYRDVETPTVLWVRTKDHGTFAYGLMGGP